MRTTAWMLSACILLTSVDPGPADAQDTVFFPGRDHVVIRTMRSVPANAFDARLHVHTVVGVTGSVSFAELDSGAVAGLHHHTREQVDVGLMGTVEATLGNHIEQLSPGFGVIIPADVNHSFVNRGPGRVTAIEFQTLHIPDPIH